LTQNPKYNQIIWGPRSEGAHADGYTAIS